MSNFSSFDSATAYILISFSLFKVAELKKTMGWLSHGGYCIKCAIIDGWAKAEVYVVVGTLISLITVEVGINVEGRQKLPNH